MASKSFVSKPSVNQPEISARHFRASASLPHCRKNGWETVGFCLADSSGSFREDVIRQSQTAHKRSFHTRTGTPVPARANGQRGIKQAGLFEKHGRQGIPP